jgi:hypothetical protein
VLHFFGIICSIWFFQLMWLSIGKPRNFVFMFLLYNFLYNQYVMWNMMTSCYKFHYYVLSKFRTKLLAANHLIVWQRTKFDTEQKSSKFLLEELILGEFPISVYSNQTQNFWDELRAVTSTFFSWKNLTLSSNTPPIPLKCNWANKISWFTQSKALLNQTDCQIIENSSNINFLINRFIHTIC